jgi:hypothetical protein
MVFLYDSDSLIRWSAGYPVLCTYEKCGHVWERLTPVGKILDRG